MHFKRALAVRSHQPCSSQNMSAAHELDWGMGIGFDDQDLSHAQRGKLAKFHFAQDQLSM